MCDQLKARKRSMPFNKAANKNLTRQLNVLHMVRQDSCGRVLDTPNFQKRAN
jgi:hypothetical protein